MSTPAVVIGDPYVTTITGVTFEFSAAAADWYSALTDGSLKADFRAAATPSDASRTFADRVVVLVGTHYCQVDLTSALYGSTTLTIDADPTVDGPFTVQYHHGSAGEPRVDIAYGGWSIAVIQDDGTGAIHAGGPLQDVPHLGLFFDAWPSGVNAGVCYDGNGGSSPSTYQIMAPINPDD